MTQMPSGYYNRHDPTKNYDQHLFRAGQGLQSAEMNEIQASQIGRLSAIGDALFSDGDLISDCQCVVNELTGQTNMSGGTLYLRGAVRSVQPAAFVIPINTTVSIGIRLVETVITEIEDPELRDPAVGTRNYGEAGAARLRVVAQWGFDSDGGSGEFFGVYTVDNGFVLSKEPPPVLDGVTQAIARYDRDSAGGNYIIEGLGLTASYDRINAKLVLLVGEGQARVNGYPVQLARGLRLNYDADPDYKAVIGEPKTFTPDGSGNMRVDLDNAPLVTLTQVRITAQKTTTLTHGAFSGAADPLPDNSVLAIISVIQGTTTYVQGVDYKLTSGDVDWSLAGAEPAPGSTYTVTYQYQSTTAATVTGQDDTGFTITGPVSGSLFTIDYTFALPRIDSIVLDADGRITRIKGVATQYAPAAPSIPETLLKIGSLSHDWFGNPTVINDAIQVLPMQELQGIRGLVFDLYDLVAQERLRNDVALSDPTAKRGLFVDPFNNDNLRDAGIVQNLAIIDGELMLPIVGTLNAAGAAIVAPMLLDYTLEAVIEQPYRTGSMKINPYQAFEPIPASMSLKPNVDFWTVVNTVWSSDETRRFVTGWGNRSITTTSEGIELVSTTTRNAEFLRPAVVQFDLSGFGAGEVLTTLTFDGIAVTPETI